MEEAYTKNCFAGCKPGSYVTACEVHDPNFIKPNVRNYQDIGRDIGALVESKQMAYGDSFGNSGAVMKILYPNGIGPDHVDDALTIVRIIDKLFRIANKKDAFGESPYRDIVGYGLLAVARDEKKANETDAASR